MRNPLPPDWPEPIKSPKNPWLLWGICLSLLFIYYITMLAAIISSSLFMAIVAATAFASSAAVFAAYIKSARYTYPLSSVMPEKVLYVLVNAWFLVHELHAFSATTHLAR